MRQYQKLLMKSDKIKEKRIEKNCEEEEMEKNVNRKVNSKLDEWNERMQRQWWKVFLIIN